MSRGDFESDVQSVGQALATNQALSITHPYYRTLVDSMERKIAELTSARGSMRASGTVSMVTVALDSEELARLSVEYPEFRLLNYGISRPAHAVWVQARRLANDWLTLQALKLGNTVAHLGGSLLTYLESGAESVHLLVDPANPVAVHERHAAAMDAYGVYTNYVAVAKDLGRPVQRQAYERFLRREGVVYTSSMQLQGVSASVLCVDGTLYPYGPMQVGTLAMACEADVVYGFFPYHPVMLLNESGEIPGTGVHFERTDDDLRLKYPEGVSGTVGCALAEWQAWLTSHWFQVGVSGKVFFQLELMRNRGGFMFYRMIRLPARPVEAEVRHALEMPMAEPCYVVDSWRLRTLGLDPRERRNWANEKYVVGQRLVDRVYQFAMQLPAEQFTRYAIRKQLHVVNDRVTIEGTSVKVNSPLGVKMVEALVVDVFARAYVDRYESGTLTGEAMAFVRQVAEFPTASFCRKTWIVACMCGVAVWEHTLQPVSSYVAQLADVVRAFFRAEPDLPAPAFDVAPMYMLLSEAASAVPGLGNNSLAAELTRRSALGATGFSARWAQAMAVLTGPVVAAASVTCRVEEVSLFQAHVSQESNTDEVVGMLRSLNPVDEAPITRRQLDALQVVRQASSERVVDFDPDPDPVSTLNDFYQAAVPGVAQENLEYDTASISLDPQDRVLSAPYMRLPKYFGDPPKPKLLYHSRLRALNVPKRQQTLQELLSAIAARNLSAPQVALPQDDAQMAQEVWDNFLDVACVPDARRKLASFACDPVSLEEDAFREWVSQATPQKLSAVKAELERLSESLAEMPVDEYLVMLKADVKPTLSTKPIENRTEPQVIVYHEKALSALFSSIFRVLVRRFLSLLKPNYHVNLLKDSRDIEDFLRGVHPFGVRGLQYLENDFSKYDKSQGKFVFELERVVFTALGMNSEMMERWLGGHVECSMRAVALHLSLHVIYQRKSGDATTAFGNVILNVVSVSYAYRGSMVVWGLFMGDDSLVCCTAVAHEEDAVQILAEVFNLGAKTYLTSAPYFASNFVVVDDINRGICLVPDPVKRVERWSMMVSGDDPQWHERFVSARDSMRVYLNCFNTAGLARAVAERYPIAASEVRGVATAVATLLSSERVFRTIWEEIPHMSNY